MELLRFSSEDDSTLGVLRDESGRLLAFTIEDEKRDTKVYGETAIPEGTYKLRLRTWGGMHETYKKRYSWHEGMIELEDVPGFTNILIHTGNTDDDTDGCILVGLRVRENRETNGYLYDSAVAYERVYKYILPLLKEGDVYLTIKSI